MTPDKSYLRRAARFLFGLLFVLFTLLVFEVGIRWTGLDMIALRPLLYYQHAVVSLHEVSPDSVLLYQLKPGARGSFGGVDFSVNSLGFRDRGRLARKAPGVFRIVCVGASYMFGALVGDDETLPHYLEEILNKSFQGRFEVWNAGVSAYDVLQEAALARLVEAKYSPDLIIFNLNGTGRRAFLFGQPYAQFFRADPSLYLENLQYVPLASSPWGLRLLSGSALYRTAVIYFNYRLLPWGPDPAFAQNRNSQYWRRYLADSRPDLPKALLVLGAAPGPDPEGKLPLIALYRGEHVPGRLPAEYFLVHPPAPVYRLQAQIAAQRLSELFPQILRKRDRSERLIGPVSALKEPGQMDPSELSESEQAMREMGRFDCLLELARALVRKEPSNVRSHLLLAESASVLGRPGLARGALRRALALSGVKAAQSRRLVEDREAWAELFELAHQDSSDTGIQSRLGSCVWPRSRLRAFRPAKDRRPYPQSPWRRSRPPRTVIS
jgi:hypothetical protein